MFTGIVEELGRIRQLKMSGNSGQIVINAHKVLEGTKIGDSIAVNGICLTVVSLESDCFTADVMAETIRRSSLKGSRPGDFVNLERAMAADGRFSGHIVSGHIDGTGTITGIRQEENAVWYTIAAEQKLLRCIVEKGSVALDGISLTVAKVTAEDFQVSVIPHTRQETALPEKRSGSVINIECDVIGKYVEKLLTGPRPEEKESHLTEGFLMEHGFL